MRTTLDIDAGLLEEAMQVTGITTKRVVIEEGLRLLVQKAARSRLASLTGTVPDAWAPTRRRQKGGR
ncbi:MAG: type II toxin-antitoxin system VapB family antitoxin [Deltaproteobacteria bacterium]|nr:type II toxin-antitoxin system VapB family antitoxin [Deltaproteobacteria bacterium]